MAKTYKSKFDGEQLWGFILAHVASPALAQVPTMFRAAARTAADKKFASLDPALRNALELCASHISAQVVRDFLAQVGDVVKQAGFVQLADSPQVITSKEIGKMIGPTGASSVDHRGRSGPDTAAQSWRPESPRQ